MSWFFITLVGPFLYALTNHIDKILLQKYFRHGGVGTLILFSSLLSALALPFLFFGDPTVFTVGIKNILVLTSVGIFNILVLWFYLLALKDEEASVAIVFYQLVPVIGLILGYMVLDEVLTVVQLIAMSIIILGTTIIAFEIDVDNKFVLRKKTIIYMISASFFWALGSVAFKFVALEENVWRSLFWEHLVLTVVGILIFVFNTSYRKHFILALRENTQAVISLNFVNEGLYMLGNFVFAFSYLLAPIALILLVDSFQPIFVLAIGIFLTLFFPNVTVEKIYAYHLWQKLLAVCITGIGTYLLLISS